MIYYPDTRQAVYEKNRKNCGPKFKYLVCNASIEHVTSLFFQKDQSLDAICGAAKTNKFFSNDQMVCTKTLYNYVDNGLLAIRNINLPLKLRRSTKGYRIKKTQETFRY